MIWECSDRYNDAVIRADLEDIYIMFHTKVCSSQFAFIGLRPRKYGICFHRKYVMSKFSSLDNVVRLFHRERVNLGTQTAKLALSLGLFVLSTG